MTIRFYYNSVDWSGEQVKSLTHGHGTDKTRFDGWVAANYDHLAISNYYDSDPASSWPLTNLASVSGGDIPAGTVGSPNAEHHSLLDAGGHFGGIGSTLNTGAAVNGPWTDFVDDVVANLLYTEAGGICANHPGLSYAGDAKIMQMLDYSRYMLGIELFNSLGDWYYTGRGWATPSAHNILKTGRRCFLFAAPDHWSSTDGVPLRGYNRLLVPSGYSALSDTAKVQACLEAIYEGRFYGSVADTSPTLIDMTADETEVTVEFDAACDITFYFSEGNEFVQQATAPTTGTTATYTLTGNEVYVRAVAETSPYEVSFTQAVMYKDQIDLIGSDRTNQSLLLRRRDMECCSGGGL